MKKEAGEWQAKFKAKPSGPPRAVIADTAKVGECVEVVRQFKDMCDEHTLTVGLRGRIRECDDVCWLFTFSGHEGEIMVDPDDLSKLKLVQPAQKAPQQANQISRKALNQSPNTKAQKHYTSPPEMKSDDHTPMVKTKQASRKPGAQIAPKKAVLKPQPPRASLRPPEPPRAHPRTKIGSLEEETAAVMAMLSTVDQMEEIGRNLRHHA